MDGFDGDEDGDPKAVASAEIAKWEKVAATGEGLDELSVQETIEACTIRDDGAIELSGLTITRAEVFESYAISDESALGALAP